MGIPTYDQLIDPLLRFLATTPVGATVGQAQEALLAGMGLTEEERTRNLPQKKLLVYKHRILWAQHRLKNAGLSTSPVRGTWQITDDGIALSRRFAALPDDVVERIAKLRWPGETHGDAAAPPPIAQPAPIPDRAPAEADIEDGASIPTYNAFIEPLLRHLAAHPEGSSTSDAYEVLASGAALSRTERAVMLPSGRQPVYKNRILWAQHRLRHAGLSSSPVRGTWVITEAGLALARRHPALPEAEIVRISTLSEATEEATLDATMAAAAPHATTLVSGAAVPPLPLPERDVQPEPVLAGAFAVELARSPEWLVPATRDVREWLQSIGHADHRKVLSHIADHVSITEIEVARMVGTPSKARRFAAALDVLLSGAPLRVRVDFVNGIKRYVREDG
jgi:restriction endonuclease Mrr